MTPASSLLLLIPVIFLGLGLWLWRRGPWQLSASRQWLLALLLFGAWSTILVSYELAASVDFLVGFIWRATGNYLLSGATLATLWATGSYLQITTNRLWLAMGAGLLLLVAAFILDPTTLFPSMFATTRLAGQNVSQFDAWGALWGATLFLPILAALIMVQQTLRRLPDSISSNQLRFWQLVLLLILAGCVPGLIRQPGQIFWPLSAAILFLTAALLGSSVLGNSQLPQIRQVYGHLARLMLTVLPVLALTFGAIWLVVRTDLGAQLTANDVGLVITATLVALAVVFMTQLFSAGLAWLGRRRGSANVMAPPRLEWKDDMLDLQPLGRAILAAVGQALSVDDVWLALTDDGPAGRLLLRPLTKTAQAQPETLALAPESPLARQWRGQARPLVNADIFQLLDFQELSDPERRAVSGWQRSIFAPLHAGHRLVGILGIAPKADQEPFTPAELNTLTALAEQFGPLLAQALSLAALRRTNQYVFAQNQTLVRENNRLQEVVGLFEQALCLIKPEMREPLLRLDMQWQALYPDIPVSVDFAEADMAEPIAALKQSMGNLLLVGNRVKKHSRFAFSPVLLAEICKEVIEQLDNMAQARRVSVKLIIDKDLPAICGDSERLKEAVQYLVHNAIKFNKVGGAVEVTCDRQNNTIRISVSDTGVGVPPERLPTVWDGFTEVQGGKGRPGMGLALTRFIVRAHGGRVAAASQYGTGSVFSFFIPIHESEVTAPLAVE